MKDCIRDATDEELRSLLNRQPIGMMEQVLIESARKELTRRQKEKK